MRQLPCTSRWATGLAVLYMAIWCIAVMLWHAAPWFPLPVAWCFFGSAALLGLAGLLATMLTRRWSPRRRCLLMTAAGLVCWQATVFITGAVAWDAMHREVIRCGAATLFVVGLCWSVWWVERAGQRIRARRIARGLTRTAAQLWVSGHRPEGPGVRRSWHPLDAEAWYYGRQNPRLRQSVTVLAAYSLLFLLVYVLLGWLAGRRGESYELPGGGGQAKTMAQTVKIQKVIRTKYVVNPYSAIKFAVPPIDEVKLQLTEATEHTYTIGYGEGEGAGFGGGTARGKVRFIRLEYAGGDWDEGMGIGGDLNMLTEYGARTRHAVADHTESRRITELTGFPEGKSPPVLYLTGQKDIALTNSEVRILRDYLVTKHGMLFGDNGGSRRFHHQFLALMHRVLPNVAPVPVPLDDVIHRVPYTIPFLPYVSPHGGKEALGWWLDGRWVCYYHPGDVGDAWSDDHAGVRQEVWEACYQLGTNVIFYAHAEYSKWLQSRK
jgi:hypothetical protein